MPSKLGCNLFMISSNVLNLAMLWRHNNNTFITTLFLFLTVYNNLQSSLTTYFFIIYNPLDCTKYNTIYSYYNLIIIISHFSYFLVIIKFSILAESGLFRSGHDGESIMDPINWVYHTDCADIVVVDDNEDDHAHCWTDPEESIETQWVALSRMKISTM